MPPKARKNIWYQVEGRQEKNYVEASAAGSNLSQLRIAIKGQEDFQVSASTLILSAKKADEVEYTILTTDFFRERCSNDLNSLISKFNITKFNPIKVTDPGMSLFSFCLLFIFLFHCRIKAQIHSFFIHLLNF